MALFEQPLAITGMSQDMTPNLPADKFSFENFNIRFSTVENNSQLVIKNEVGPAIIDSLEHYRLPDESESRKVQTLLDYSVGVDSEADPTCFNFTIIGVCPIDKYLVVFGKDTSEEGKDYIVRVEYDQDSGKYKCCYMFDGVDLNFSVDKPIETHAYSESELLKRVYFCDGENFVRSINVVDEDAVGNVALLNIGRNLELNETLTVERVTDRFGSLPGCKIQFGFSYGNDSGSLTPLVDYSALYDCTYNHSGIAPDADVTKKYSDYTYKIRVDNVDSQFKWINFYIFIRTSLDSIPVIYRVTKPIVGSSVEYVVDLGDGDIILSNETLNDLIGGEPIIPLTLEIFENRMFAGNIKTITRQLPEFSANTDVQGEFFTKKIGEEVIREDYVYNYDPMEVTFAGSSYDNKGFRKGNWYKFGIVGQYADGHWTNVMHLLTMQCNKRGKTVESRNATLRSDNLNTINIYNVKFKVQFTASGIEKLKQLEAIGIKKIKPVCVCPSDSEKTVITQGILNPTVYRGRNRLNLGGNPFAYPSWFFRPKKQGMGIENDYPFTIRNVKDLAQRNNVIFNDAINGDDTNIVTWGDFLAYHDNFSTTPSYTNFDSDHCHWNDAFREFRHGFSLPPKDRINAEMECSEFSLNDYSYSDVLNSNLLNSIADFGLFDSSGLSYEKLIIDNKKYACSNYTSFLYWNDTPQFDSSTNLPNGDFSGLNGDGRFLTFRPDLETNAYENTVFVDETICTFNSPEIDYVAVGGVGSSNVLINSNNYQLSVCGASEISGSLSDMAIKPTTTILALDEAAQPFWGYETVQGTVIKDTRLWPLTSVKSQLFRRTSSASSPFALTAGPFWFDKLMVDSLVGKNEEGGANKIIKDSSKQYNALNESQLNLSTGLAYNTRVAIIVNFLLANPMDGFIAGLVESASGYRLKRRSIENSPEFTQTFYGELGMNRTSNTAGKGKTQFNYFQNTLVFGKVDDEEKDRAVCLSENTALGNNYNAYGYFGITPTTSTGQFYIRALNMLHHGNSGNSVEVSSYNNDAKFMTNVWLLSNLPREGDNGPILPSSSNGAFTYYFANPITRKLPTDPFDTIMMAHPSALPTNGWGPEGLLVNSSKWPFVKENRDSVMLSPSIYGSHYYAPFSTEFPHCLFDPYYAHVVYPFMHDTNNVPFCGTSTIYEGAENSRPDYNLTSSMMYSNSTIYFEDSTPIETDHKYVNEKLTRFNISKLGDKQNQFYGVTDTDLFKYKTVSLTAATKWYRGWVDVLNFNPIDYAQLCTGWREDDYEESIFSNLVFSGYLPQLFSKSGQFSSEDEHNINDIESSQIDSFRKTIAGTNQWFSLTFNSSPHMVVASKDNAPLIPIKSDSEVSSYIDYYNTSDWLNIRAFNTQFYYKDFLTAGRKCFVSSSNNAFKAIRVDDGSESVNNFLPGDDENPKLYEDTNLFLSACGFGAHMSIYPHTGNWYPLTSVPYINGSDSIFDLTDSSFTTCGTDNENNCKNHFTATAYWERANNINIAKSVNEASKYYDWDLGKIKDSKYYLYLADYINKDNEENPYSENVEYYIWQPCGYSVALSDITGSKSVEATSVEFLEGDTYMIRYDCRKTVLNGNPVELSTHNGISECASVYLESYINLDGRYDDYDLKRSDSEYSSLMNCQSTDIDKINPVYSQRNNLFTYNEINDNYKATSVTYYPTNIKWSPVKINGESFDVFGTFPAYNTFNVEGTYGPISKLIEMPSHQVLCFQDHGISIPNINPQGLIKDTNGNTIEINANSASVLVRTTYIDKTYGCENKWTVTSSPFGVSFIDNTKKLIGRVTKDGVEHTSVMSGMDSWVKKNVTLNNKVWDPLFSKHGFVSYYDTTYHDIYFITDDVCLSYNGQLGAFTSFYAYNYVPYITNYLDSTYSFKVKDNKSYFYKQYSNERVNDFYGDVYDYYIDFLVNPCPTIDKVFNFITYHNECLDESGRFVPVMNGFNFTRVFNYSQRAMETINRMNTRQKFRTWRTDIPREGMNRIRSNWCRIKLLGNKTGIYSNLYDISINYSIPEFPRTTTVSDES